MFALLATTAASTPNEPDTMDVDDDPEKLAEKIRLKIAELEAERAHAEDMFDDTTFIDKQIDELKEFMHELDTGLKEALGGGTKRERSRQCGNHTCNRSLCEQGRQIIQEFHRRRKVIIITNNNEM